MDLRKPKISPTDFADAIGVTSDNLRDWRRRGMDFGCEAAVNGRKNYCAFDLIEVAVWMQLRVDYFDDLREAFRVARLITPELAKRMGYDVSDVWPFPYASGKGSWAFLDPRQGVLHFSDGNDGLEKVEGRVSIAIRANDLMSAVFQPSLEKKLRETFVS